MATTNAINNATSQLTIDPGAAGDSFVQFNINTTGEFRIGVDDSASDAFKISQGSALGTNDTFIMTDAGENTWPLQPAFLAQLGTSDTNVTGNGTTFTIGSGNAYTEVFDQGGDFVTTGTFTAPITGLYFLGTSVLLGDITAATSMTYTIVTSNRTWSGNKWNPSTSYNLGAQLNPSFSAFLDMDAGDTAINQMALNGVGADTCDIVGTGGSDCRTEFNGRLVC